MRAILLAAGVGSRIAPHIGNMPKSLVDVGGERLIVRTVEMLRRNHLEVTVITGFQHTLIEEALPPYEVDIVYNPFYKNTNSMGSLWFARDRIRGDEIMIANADVFYEQTLLDKAFACPYKNFLVRDTNRVDEGDYFFLTDNGRLLKYGKQLTREERDSEYVGFAFLRKDWVTRFRGRLNDMVEAGEYNLWWENVLYSFVDEGAHQVQTLDVAGEFWAEVDTVEDYNRILAYVAAKQAKASGDGTDAEAAR